MVEHNLKREYEGIGIDQVMTPTCSCGWKGVGYGAWHDYQHTHVREQESGHIWRSRYETGIGVKDGLSKG